MTVSRFAMGVAAILFAASRQLPVAIFVRRRPCGAGLTSRAAVWSNCSWVKGFVSIVEWPKLSGKA
jgi:hypothetical protein